MEWKKFSKGHPKLPGKYLVTNGEDLYLLRWVLGEMPCWVTEDVKFLQSGFTVKYWCKIPKLSVTKEQLDKKDMEELKRMWEKATE